MKKQSVLFKVSGDLIYNEEVLEEIEKAVNNYSRVGFIYGFGIILSERLKEKGIHFKYLNGIRETTQEGLKIAFEISEEIKKFLTTRLPNVELISPVVKSGNEIINTNADELVIKTLEFYDKAIIYTLNGRNKENFKNFSNIEIRRIAKR